MTNGNGYVTWKIFALVVSLLVSAIGGLYGLGYMHSTLDAHPAQDERTKTLAETQRMILHRQQVMMEALLIGAEDAERRRLLREFYTEAK